MKHSSVAISPVEIIDIEPYNPLISKVNIKVCYVGDEPNRNRSVITKKVATDLAKTIPGSPIVGFFSEANQDFEGHNRSIDISGSELKVRDTTKPYGFVDLGAKVWFQKFLDDGTTEHEYLCTTGWLWTGQYPEAKRVLDEGNNQSMELDEDSINAFWTKGDKTTPKLFIINEAIMSKLCILGEDVEPCFEGAQIQGESFPVVNFAVDDKFTQQLYSLMEQMKKILNEGGAPTMEFTTYSVEIGDALWTALYSYIDATYPSEIDKYMPKYSIEGVYEDVGNQKFAILRDRTDMRYYRMNFTLTEDTGLVIGEELTEVTKSYSPKETPQFEPAAVEAYELQYKTEHAAAEVEAPEGATPESVEEPVPANYEEEPVVEEEPQEEENSNGEGETNQYTLEEIPEYIELSNKYSELETNYSTLLEEVESLRTQNTELTQFKAEIDRKAKQDMINSFYMLSDEDKKDCVENIDKYSVDDIEAKLSIICVRNKVSFDLDTEDNETGPVTFNLTGDMDNDSSVPEWVKAVLQQQNELH